jgi:hypothetical protein
MTRREDVPDLRIRRSTVADAPALERLAQLDGAARPAGAHLVAEEDGELRAALPLAGGSVIADPFHRTQELVTMLSLRAGRVEPAPRQRRPRRGLRVPGRGVRTPAPAPAGPAMVPRPGHP